ncbi:TPA: hypothetical protein K4452_002610 [Enterococcus faecalis]|uniref:hypothetical protein n=1 Tax=Enterococcus faecalis TaxID=1351 RepID=UPI001CAFD649|nr:hypothetical protein [Enterococcus faecalis]HBI3769200.1 hypothetical protein [Enterococcus faecalis]
MSRFFKFVSLLGVMLIGLSALVGAGTSVYAIENEAPIVTSINKEDYENVQNYGEIIAALQITEDSFLSAYRIDDKSVGSTVGIINFYDSSSDTYYNLYIDQERKIDYITTQKENSDGTASMSLYQWNGRDFDTGFIETIDSQGNFIENHRTKRAAVNKIALGWACLFSSYIACVGASAGATAAGSLIGGPWGAAVGIGGGFACKYLFQHLIEKFGGKDAACTWIKNLKNTWSAITN